MKLRSTVWSLQDFKMLVFLSQHYSTVSYDPSEIIDICGFAAQEAFIIILMLKTVCADSYFVEIVLFSQFFD